MVSQGRLKEAIRKYWPGQALRDRYRIVPERLKQLA
jgi:hypothetical protein